MTLVAEQPVQLAESNPDVPLQIGQTVLVTLDLYDLANPSAESTLGPWVRQNDQFIGEIALLPDNDKPDSTVHYTHIRRHDRQTTYVIPTKPDTIEEIKDRRTVVRLRVFSILPLDDPTSAAV